MPDRNRLIPEPEQQNLLEVPRSEESDRPPGLIQNNTLKMEIEGNAAENLTVQIDWVAIGDSFRQPKEC